MWYNFVSKGNWKGRTTRYLSTVTSHQGVFKEVFSGIEKNKNTITILGSGSVLVGTICYFFGQVVASKELVAKDLLLAAEVAAKDNQMVAKDLLLVKKDLLLVAEVAAKENQMLENTALKNSLLYGQSEEYRRMRQEYAKRPEKVNTSKEQEQEQELKKGGE